MKNISIIIAVFVLLSCGKQEETKSNLHEEISANDSAELVIRPQLEKYRPVFHFTPEANWMNDPNGMVYYKGEYHLFYQYYPEGNVWGPMHWGHAVSSDMINWEHLPIALYPDSLGYIFSGSAVIDWNNTSGFGDAENPPMVAIFTYHDPVGEKNGTIDYQTQGIAYSLDKGRTWTKYDKNPVLSNPGIRDFRDPKVSWMEEYNKWVMILAVQDHVEIYSSPDLKLWTKESEFGQNIGAHGGVWECPDLFPLKDEHGETKWIMLVSINPGGPQGGSATQYFIGYFDGKAFSSMDETIRWLDFGADNYAGVTWNDIPKKDGRRLFMGWMSNWQYATKVPTTEWRSAMTLPRELSLKNGKLYNYPVIEFLDRMVKEQLIPNSAFNLPDSVFGLSLEVQNNADFELIFESKSDDLLKIGYVNGAFFLDRVHAGINSFHPEFARKHTAPNAHLGTYSVDIFFDTSSIEMFVNNGEIVMTDIVFPESPYSKMTISGEQVTKVSFKSIEL